MTTSVWERRAWAAGIVFVVALLAEAVISTGLPINQDDSAAKIARALQDHRREVAAQGPRFTARSTIKASRTRCTC